LLKDVVFQPTGADASMFAVSYWKVDPGGGVSEGGGLLVVESVEEKVALVVPSPYTGVLREVVARTGRTISAGDVLGRIDVP
jgi:pyruvate/2-oxoglutarate dehydrogenase complex dihydrolipoamide acyltransferase (E2) component